jgi:L-iditol 2-dehydrogenase
VGWGGEVPVSAVIAKGLWLRGAWHYNLNDAPEMMALVSRSVPLLSKLITHTFPMAAVNEAWALQSSGQCGKVVLHPWG